MADTGPAKLPGIPAYKTGDTALANTLQAIIERLEVREGNRGNSAEKVATQRDIASMTQFMTSMTDIRPPQTGDIPIDIGGGRTGSVPMTELVKGLTSNKAFTDAIQASTLTNSTDPNAGATESARVEATLRALIGELGFKTEFGYADGPYGKRWYIGPDIGLKSHIEGDQIRITPVTGPSYIRTVGPEYDTTVRDVLQFLHDMIGRIAYLEQREKDITRVSTQYFGEIFDRMTKAGI